MTIKNPFMAKLLIKVLRLETLKVSFVYEKDIYDEDLTKLGFLNQVKGEFNEQAKLFNEELDEQIEEASRSI